jgi:hypothetical protein
VRRGGRPAAADVDVLPGLFAIDIHPVARPTVNQERDRILARVAEKADRQRAQFIQDARAFVLDYLAQHGPKSGEQLSSAAKAAGLVPEDDRAFGPVYMGLAREQLIQRVGTVRRERGHGTAGGNLWNLWGRDPEW